MKGAFLLKLNKMYTPEQKKLINEVLDFIQLEYGSYTFDIYLKQYKEKHNLNEVEQPTIILKVPKGLNYRVEEV